MVLKRNRYIEFAQFTYEPILKINIFQVSLMSSCTGCIPDLDDSVADKDIS